MTSVTHYDGWQTLETVHSMNISGRSYELLNVGGLGRIRLMSGVIWPQANTSQKNFCLKAKRQMGISQKWPVNVSPALREIWKC